MPRVNKSAIGTKFFKEGSQNQQILANFWGNGKTFTSEDLRDMDIMSPGARLTELREAGFNIKATPVTEGVQGRPAVEYTILKRRTIA